MKTVYKTLALLACLLLSATSAMAVDQEKGQEKAIFDRLVQEVRDTRHKYEVTVRKGVAEARKNNGKASLTTQADVLALRDTMDRAMSRLRLLAHRHGWAVPDFEVKPSAAEAAHPSRKGAIFGPAEAIIKVAFAREAKALATVILLPTTPVRSSASRQQAQTQGAIAAAKPAGGN